MGRRRRRRKKKSDVVSGGNGKRSQTRERAWNKRQLRAQQLSISRLSKPTLRHIRLHSFLFFFFSNNKHAHKHTLTQTHTRFVPSFVRSLISGRWGENNRNSGTKPKENLERKSDEIRKSRLGRRKEQNNRPLPTDTNTLVEREDTHQSGERNTPHRETERKRRRERKRWCHPAVSAAATPTSQPQVCHPWERNNSRRATETTGLDRRTI